MHVPKACCTASSLVCSVQRRCRSNARGRLVVRLRTHLCEAEQGWLRMFAARNETESSARILRGRYIDDG